MEKEIVTHEAISFNENDAKLFHEDFKKGSWAATQFPDGWKTLFFDKRTIALQECLLDMISSSTDLSSQDIRTAGGLEKLHTVLPKEMQSLDKHELNNLTKKLYDQTAEFLAEYHSFIKHVVDNLIKEPCLFQKTPTIRAHFPNQKGFNWSPRYHTDIMLGHPPQEINIWVPFTNVSGSNSLRLAEMQNSINFLEDERHDLSSFATRVQTDTELQAALKESSTSLEMEYGEYVVFDPRCLHAGQNNLTSDTRLSMDIRILPISDYHNMSLQYRGTGRRQVRFERGDYYDDRSSDMLP